MSTSAETAAGSSIEEDLETADKFFRYFQHEVTALQQQMDRLGDMALAGGEQIDATEHCMAGIAKLSNDVKDASVYLPAHDQKTYMEAVRALRERLVETRSQFAPRQKFSFKTAHKNPSAISVSDATQLSGQRKHKASGDGDTSNESSMAPSPTLGPSPPNEDEDQPQPKEEADGEEKQDQAAGGAESSAHEPEQEPETEPQQEAEAVSSSSDEDDGASKQDDIVDGSRNPLPPGTFRRPSFSSSTSVSIASHKSLHIVLPASAGHATTTGNLRHLSRCIIDMTEPTTHGRPFAGLTLRNTTRSLLICGHVSGSAFVTDLHSCIVVVASRQFRMHDCTACDVYLQVASRPIIENCKGIRFAPLPGCYASESERHIENRWDQVDDFKWLRSGEASPNWKTLPQAERVDDGVWRETVPGGEGIGLEEILEAVGIGTN